MLISVSLSRASALSFFVSWPPTTGVVGVMAVVAVVAVVASDVGGIMGWRDISSVDNVGAKLSSTLGTNGFSVGALSKDIKLSIDVLLACWPVFWVVVVLSCSSMAWGSIVFAEAQRPMLNALLPS
jgi:hypothetical protein